MNLETEGDIREEILYDFCVEFRFGERLELFMHISHELLTP